MKAAIALDSWKLSIFKRCLDAAGYAYEQHPGLVANTITLTVIADDQSALVAVVKAANDEAAQFKENKRLEN